MLLITVGMKKDQMYVMTTIMIMIMMMMIKGTEELSDAHGSKHLFMSFYQQTVSHWHAVIYFRVPDVLLYSYLSGVGLKLIHK